MNIDQRYIGQRYDLAINRGHSAGNYANAYVSTDLDDAWERHVASSDFEQLDTVERSLVRAGFVIGFFSSYESHEVPGEHAEEHEATLIEHGDHLRALGVAVE